LPVGENTIASDIFFPASLAQFLLLLLGMSFQEDAPLPGRHHRVDDRNADEGIQKGLFVDADLSVLGDRLTLVVLTRGMVGHQGAPLALG
jgi:hypothetical protein